MEFNYKIILVVIGIIVGIFGALTYQWLLEVIAIAIIVSILIMSDVVEWIKVRSEKPVRDGEAR